MKKILYILLLLPFFAKAQVVLPVRDTIRPSNIGAAYTPSFSDAMQNGILTHYVRRGTSNVYDLLLTSKYLRANYLPLTGTASDLNMGIYGVTAQGFKAQGVSGGTGAGYQFKAFNSTAVADWQFLELNSNKEFRLTIPQANGGGIDTPIFRLPKTTKIIDFQYNPSYLGAPLLTSATIKPKIDSLKAASNIWSNTNKYSTDGGATGTTINSTGVSSTGVTGFQNVSNGNTANVNGNAIAIISNTTNDAVSLRPTSIRYNTGSGGQLSLVAIPTANNRTQSFQDDNGTVALTKNIYQKPVAGTTDSLVTSGSGGVLNRAALTQGPGITITRSAGLITIAAQSNVVEITGTTQTATGNTIYIPHNASLTTITVPVTTTIGTLYQVIGEGAGGWKLQLPAGYTAVGVGSFTTTSGGSLNSSDKNCTITIRLTNTNKFTVTTSQGTINPL